MRSNFTCPLCKQPVVMAFTESNQRVLMDPRAPKRELGYIYPIGRSAMGWRIVKVVGRSEEAPESEPLLYRAHKC